MDTTSDSPGQLAAYGSQGVLGVAPQVLSAILDAMPNGVALCDADNRVIFVNEAARRELRGGRALALGPQGHLTASDTTVQGRLRGAIGAAIRSHRHEIIDASVSGGSLFVAVVPLTNASVGTAGALLIFSRHTVCSQPALQLLGRLFGLTPAERDVLGELLGGNTLQQISESRQRELSTLRAQVVAIRGKFGHRRVEHVLRQVALMPWPIESVGVSSNAPSMSRAPLREIAAGA